LDSKAAINHQYFERKDLVVLMYASNSCYTTLVGADDPKVSEAKVTIDAKAGTWTGQDPSYYAVVTRPIGTSRYCDHRSRWGVIGVYDRTNLTHLNQMISTAREAVAVWRYSDD